jgi:predicted nucleic acid-binding protein
MKIKPIYLDVCALCRPFDDQKYMRIRLETEAINLIISTVKIGSYKLMISKVHIAEIDAILDPIERIELQMVLNKWGERIKTILTQTRARAEFLVNSGFGIADAAHVAFAEQENASFISCDDRLIKKCLNNKLKIWCGSPVAFCEMEELK